MFIIYFVDDGLFISQNKSLNISNSYLFYSYNVMTKLLERFGLIVEHSKTEVFHFNRSQGSFNPLPLDLSPIGGSILKPKSTWKYLGFIFDRKLLFHQHINFYTNKVMSMVKCMKILGNLSQSINLTQKCLLYRCCVLPITLYGFQLWFYNHVPLSYTLKILGKMQRKAAIWILGVFKTSPSLGIEAIVGLIPIKLHLQKLGRRSQLWAHSLPPNHLIQTIMESYHGTHKLWHPALLDTLTNCQRSHVKGYLVDTNNKFNRIFPFFSPLHSELSPGLRIIDNFSDQFSFNLCNKGKNNKIHLQQLNNMVIKSSDSPSTAIVIMDASIKNNIATSILHMHTFNSPLIKTLHHTVFVTSTEAELFTIRCGINQASNHEDISKIIIITDSIHMAKKIFDPFLSNPYGGHSYQTS